MRRAFWLMLVVLVPLLAGLGWRTWQGPPLSGYVLESRPLIQRVVASGVVESQSLVQMGSEITGTVTRRLVREGDSVRAGDLLLELRDDEPRAKLREAEATLRQLIEHDRPQAETSFRDAETQLAQATRERQRRETLHASGAIPQESLEQARQHERNAQESLNRARLTRESLAKNASQEQQLQQRIYAARAAVARTRLYAPADGVVQSRHVEPGDLVQPSKVLFEIARTNSREIVLPLDEKSLAPVAIGQKARVIADAYPEKPLNAEVSFIAPAVDPARGTVDVHLNLTESADFLRQGMTVSVDIRTAARERALVIPHDALHQRSAQNATVFILNNGEVQERRVELGLRGSTASEVRTGLHEGDIVLIGSVTAGQRGRLNALPLPNLVTE